MPHLDTSDVIAGRKFEWSPDWVFVVNEGIKYEMETPIINSNR
jgi:hypothetical protein